METHLETEIKEEVKKEILFEEETDDSFIGHMYSKMIKLEDIKLEIEDTSVETGCTLKESKPLKNQIRCKEELNVATSNQSSLNNKGGKSDHKVSQASKGKRQTRKPRTVRKLLKERGAKPGPSVENTQSSGGNQICYTSDEDTDDEIQYPQYTRTMGATVGNEDIKELVPTPNSHNNAMSVTRTPGGSQEKELNIQRTLGGNVPHLEEDQLPPLSWDVLERLEAMDMSEEELEEVMKKEPWHMRRWVQNLTGQECSTTRPLSPSTTAEDCLTSASGSASAAVHAQEASITRSVPKASSVDVSGRPSTSGMLATSRRVTRLEREGSEFDSEFDDEFDDTPMENAAFSGIERDIPYDEELDGPVQELISSAERAKDDEADRMLGVSSSFIWEDSFDSFRGAPEHFSGPTPGPVKDYDSPYDAFTDIWNEDIIQLIAQETNRYAKQTIDKAKAEGTMKPSSRLHHWTDTDADEILLLFAIYMYMGIDSRPSREEYWKSNYFLEMPMFRQLMSCNRYILLSKFFHFVDNSDTNQMYLRCGGVTLSPELAKLAPVISHLDTKFSTLYNLSREISIDESLTLFKDRLSWDHVIRAKTARFVMKSYELCESRSGYLYKFQIYTGKNSNSVGSGYVVPSADLGGKSTKVVLDLLKGLEYRGHCVAMDNFYNCPSLARYLKSLGFDCVGTLRPNRRHVPNDIAKAPNNVAKGTIMARHCGDVSVIAWKDSRLVTLISTYHSDETYVESKAGKLHVKPVCVRDLNTTMGGVDLKNQKLSMYMLERKRGLKWYIKIFKRLLNVSILNAFVMTIKSLERRNKPLMTHREFRFQLADALVVKHRPGFPQHSEPAGDLMRLMRNIVHCPETVCGRNNRKRCVVCQKQGKQKPVRTKCITCEVFLCFENCWEEWHSLAELKVKKCFGRKRRRNQ